MALRSETKDGETIWLRSSCAAPIQGVGGERGQEWLNDTFIRTRDGHQVGCQAVVLAAASPVLRLALEDATNTSEEPPLIIMPYNYLEEINNLLSLLYTGKCNETPELNNMATMLDLDPAKVKEQVRIKDPVRIKTDKTVVTHDVKDEPKDETEDYDYEQFERSSYSRSSSDGEDDDDDSFIDDDSEFEDAFVKKKGPKKKIKKENGSAEPKPKRPRNKIRFDDDGNQLPPRRRIKEHNCPDCPDVLTTKKDLLKHRRTEHGYVPPPAPRTRVNCEICWKDIDKSYLKTHMASHTGDQSITCPECGKKFKNDKTLKAHMIIHTGIQNYHCEDCGNSFFTKPALINHRNWKHSTDRFVTCQECDKLCRNKYELAKHMKRHTGQREFECSWEGCGKRFLIAQTRDHHEKIHKGIKEFQCTICVKQFTQKSQLTVHMKRHMGIKDHECTVCGRAYVEPAGARKCCHAKKDNTKPPRPKWAPPLEEAPPRVDPQTGALPGQHTTDRIPQRMPERMPERMPDRIPDRMPDRMHDRMLDRMPERMPNRIPDRMPERMPDRMPERMQDRMQERMQDRMPERMQDRMPHSLIN